MTQQTDQVPAIEALVDGFLNEGVDTFFGVIGNRNMHWAYLMEQRGARFVHARHEHAAVSMADGFARIAGGVGVASVTSGPGLTHTATAIAIAAERGVPLVIYGGDVSTTARYAIQGFAQEGFAHTLGAQFIAVRSAKRMKENVREAFYRARSERVPVILGVPTDILDKPVDPAPLTPSRELVTTHDLGPPAGEAVAAAARALAAAKRPMIVIGRGVSGPAAVDEVARLADQLQAPIAASLPAGGVLAHHEHFVGIMGGLASPTVRQLAHEADLLVVLGAKFGHYTSDGDKLLGDTPMVHVDLHPAGLIEGYERESLKVVGDVAACVAAIRVHDAMQQNRQRAAWHVDGVREADAVSTASAGADGTLRTDAFIRALDEQLPADMPLVVGLGHFMHYAVAGLVRRIGPGSVLAHDFGSIGQALPAGIGASLAHATRTLVVEGDGSIMQHIQELETAVRYAAPLLVVVVNDGGYGAEFHKLRATGLSDQIARYPTLDIAAIAASMGCVTHTVHDLAQLPALVAELDTADGPVVWDVHVDADVLAPTYRPTALQSPIRQA